MEVDVLLVVLVLTGSKICSGLGLGWRGGNKYTDFATTSIQRLITNWWQS